MSLPITSESLLPKIRFVQSKRNFRSIFRSFPFSNLRTTREQLFPRIKVHAYVSRFTPDATRSYTNYESKWRKSPKGSQSLSRSNQISSSLFGSPEQNLPVTFSQSPKQKHLNGPNRSMVLRELQKLEDHKRRKRGMYNSTEFLNTEFKGRLGRSPYLMSPPWEWDFTVTHPSQLVEIADEMSQLNYTEYIHFWDYLCDKTIEFRDLLSIEDVLSILKILSYVKHRRVDVLDNLVNEIVMDIDKLQVDDKVKFLGLYHYFNCFSPKLINCIIKSLQRKIPRRLNSTKGKNTPSLEFSKDSNLKSLETDNDLDFDTFLSLESMASLLDALSHFHIPSYPLFLSVQKSLLSLNDTLDYTSLQDTESHSSVVTAYSSLNLYLKALYSLTNYSQVFSMPLTSLSPFLNILLKHSYNKKTESENEKIHLELGLDEVQNLWEYDTSLQTLIQYIETVSLTTSFTGLPSSTYNTLDGLYTTLIQEFFKYLSQFTTFNNLQQPLLNTLKLPSIHNIFQNSATYFPFRIQATERKKKSENSLLTTDEQDDLKENPLFAFQPVASLPVDSIIETQDNQNEISTYFDLKNAQERFKLTDLSSSIISSIVRIWKTQVQGNCNYTSPQQQTKHPQIKNSNLNTLHKQKHFLDNLQYLQISTPLLHLLASALFSFQICSTHNLNPEHLISVYELLSILSINNIDLNSFVISVDDMSQTERSIADIIKANLDIKKINEDVCCEISRKFSTFSNTQILQLYYCSHKSPLKNVYLQHALYKYPSILRVKEIRSSFSHLL